MTVFEWVVWTVAEIACLVIGYRMGVSDERSDRWPARHRRSRRKP